MDREGRNTLRALAGDLVEIAGGEVQEQRCAGWRASNGLRPHRPMIWITEVPWGEFERRHDELRPTCAGAAARHMESVLRRRLFVQRHFRCDEVEDGIWWVPKQYRGADYGIEIREDLIDQGDSYVKSHHYGAVIAGPQDIEKIRMPSVRYDHEATCAVMRPAEEAFGDVMPVRAHGPRQHWFSPWDDLVRWIGVTEALIDLVDRPQFIHAVLRRMTDAFVMRMRQYEALGELEDSNSLLRVGSGAAGWTDELVRQRGGGLRLRDQWGGATAQIFGEVSPEMHQQFALQYETEVMELCGLNYYGCCEPLHPKVHLLDRVPRLRKISISPWGDAGETAARAGRRYVFSHKPNPAVFATDEFDLAAAEQDVRRRITASRGMSCEIIMKDISTVRGDVGRLVRWTEAAMRLAEEHAC